MATKVTKDEIEMLPRQEQRIMDCLSPEWETATHALAALNGAGGNMTLAQFIHYCHNLERRSMAQVEKRSGENWVRRAIIVTRKHGASTRSPLAIVEVSPPKPDALTRLDDVLTSTCNHLETLRKLQEAAAQVLLEVAEAMKQAEAKASQVTPEELAVLRRKAAKWDNLQAALGEED